MVPFRFKGVRLLGGNVNQRTRAFPRKPEEGKSKNLLHFDRFLLATGRLVKIKSCVRVRKDSLKPVQSPAADWWATGPSGAAQAGNAFSTDACSS